MLRGSLDPVVVTAFWSATTIALYMVAKRVHRALGRWWTSPLGLAPVLIGTVALLLHTSYHDYIGRTHWLVTLLGPVTVAFAVPIYEQRALVRRYWPVLIVGVLVGSTTAMLSAWGLASLLGLSDTLRLSLLPRSMSTPFAMTVSGDLGGVPDLTAVFVAVTGVAGAAMAEALLNWLPLRTVLARGTLLGMGAHGAGVAKAHQIGRQEGSVAGLVMVLVGMVNVLAAPMLANLLR